MTEISFHFNAPDKVGYACRLLRKAYGRGNTLMVTGSQALLETLDAALWTFSDTDFLPHARADASDAAVLARTPIVLARSAAEGAPREVLVNLGEQVPQGFERYERLVEVVGTQDADRLAARARWKHYRDRGYALQQHDLAKDG